MYTMDMKFQKTTPLAPRNLLMTLLKKILKLEKFLYQTTRMATAIHYSNYNKLECPLLVICGCTGTGKSELGIAIAREFNGEVVNADSMQIYKGLDIATNKLTKEEMAGIPHHLIGFLEPTYSKYNVQEFRDAALEAIRNIWDNGNLPIIVGGTAYYIESIIFENNLLNTNREQTEKIRHELLQKFPTVELLYEELKRVDAEQAAELHMNSAYKVLRALEVFYTSGKTKTEHLKEQREKTGSNLHYSNKLRFKNTFLINLDAEKQMLIGRLDQRVSAMLQRGLLEELIQFYGEYRDEIGSHGIMQSIGMKEFLPYLQLDESERQSEKGSKMLEKCKTMVEIQNRQYAQSQRKWFYNRIIKRGMYREIPKSIVVDISKDFKNEIIPYVLNLVKHFLMDSDHFEETLASDSPVKMDLTPLGEVFNRPDYKETCRRLKHCAVCGMDIQGISQWDAHLKGRRHRKMLAAKNTKLKEEAQSD